MLSRTQLHQYQLKAVSFLNSTKTAALFSDMGTGKTITTLTHLADNNYKALITAPLRVAETVWAHEAKQWEHTAKLTFSHILGGKAARETALAAPASVYVMNVENIQWLAEHHGDWIARMRFDTLVLDELTLWKSMGKRWKALHRLRELFPRKIGLTGTPTPNGMLDLWPQCQILKEGMITRTMTQYKQYYFYNTDKYGWNWNLRHGADSLIFAKIAPYVMRVTNAELDMPELNVQRVAVNLPPAAARAGSIMLRDGVLLVDKSEIVAEAASAVGIKLMQISNGCIYDEERNVHVIHDAKLKATKEIITELQGAPVLIAYHFRHDLDTLRAAFPDAEVLQSENGAALNADIAERWNRGEIPILLGHPQAMGHGMNLQRGGHHVIFYGLTWNLEHYEQLIARLYRQGQQNKHVFVHLLCGLPIDFHIADALIKKANVQDAVLKYLAEHGHENTLYV